MLMPKFILIFVIGNVVDISSGKFVSNPESWKLKFDEGRQKEVEQSREASLDAGKKQIKRISKRCCITLIKTIDIH